MMPQLLTPETVRIRIVVPDKYLQLLAESNIVDHCEAYLKGLLQALSLPEDIDVTIEPATSSSDSRDILLTIQDVPVKIWTPLVDGTESLAQTLCYMLYRCRSMLINEQMVKMLWSSSFSERHVGLTDHCLAALLKYCREMVQLGKKPAFPSCWNSSEIAEPTVTTEKIEQTIEEEMAREPLSLCLCISPEQYSRCFDGSGQSLPLSGEEKDFPAMLRMMNDGLFWELGLVCRIDQVMPDPTLQVPWFRITLNKIMTPQIKGLLPGEFLVNETVDRLPLLNIKGIAAINPANGIECARVNGGTAVSEICRQAGLTTWGPEGFMILCVSSEVRHNAGAFVSDNLTLLYEAQLRQAFPELVSQAVKRFNCQDLTRVLRLLVDEELSIRDLRTILEAMLSITSVTTADFYKDIVFSGHCGLACPVTSLRALEDLCAHHIADCVRIAMKRYIAHKYARGGNTLIAYLLSPSIEERLRIEESLSKEERIELLEAVGAKIANLPLTYQSPVILTTHDVRRPLRKILKLDFPFLAVLSYQELPPHLNIQPFARIDWTTR